MAVENLIGQMGLGACLGLAAVGSAAGTGIAGSATIGAWKKCLVQNKPLPFIMVAFAGSPLTQIIYGFILMQTLAAASVAGTISSFGLLGLGVFSGLGMGFSAFMQAVAAAAAADAYGETGKGFGNYMLILGLCETVALFTMVFAMLMAGSGV